MLISFLRDSFDDASATPDRGPRWTQRTRRATVSVLGTAACAAILPGLAHALSESCPKTPSTDTCQHYKTIDHRQVEKDVSPATLSP